MWTRIQTTQQGLMVVILLVEAFAVVVTLVGLVLWGLLAALGDQSGATGARSLAVTGGISLGLLQILLVHLLALQAVAVKMEHQTGV